MMVEIRSLISTVRHRLYFFEVVTLLNTLALRCQPTRKLYFSPPMKAGLTALTDTKKFDPNARLAGESSLTEI
jgi:hypothetical protein